MKLLLNWGKTTFSVTVSHGVHTFSLTHGAFSFLLVDVFPSAGKMKQTHRFDFWFFQHGAHQTGCSYLLGSPQKHFGLLSKIMAPSWLCYICVCCSGHRFEDNPGVRRHLVKKSSRCQMARTSNSSTPLSSLKKKKRAADKKTHEVCSERSRSLSYAHEST